MENVLLSNLQQATTNHFLSKNKALVPMLPWACTVPVLLCTYTYVYVNVHVCIYSQSRCLPSFYWVLCRLLTTPPPQMFPAQIFFKLKKWPKINVFTETAL